MKLKIEQVENGYILYTNVSASGETYIFKTLEELINEIAYSLGEAQIGETIRFVIEKDTPEELEN